MNKLLIIASIPIVTLLVYSIQDIDTEYNNLLDNKKNISKLILIKKSSDLLHELQKERGLSYMHLISDTDIHKKITTQRKLTDKAIQSLNDEFKLIKQANSYSMIMEDIHNIQSKLFNIAALRENLILKKVDKESLFIYYTFLTSKLIHIISNLTIYTSSQETDDNIGVLYDLIKLQEFAGKERAFSTKLISSIEYQDMYRYNNLLRQQQSKIDDILLELNNEELSNKLLEINKKYDNNKFGAAREEIINHDKESHKLKEVFSTIGFGGITQNIQLYEKTKDLQYFEKAINARKQFITLMQEYIDYSDKHDTFTKIALELQKSFDAISKKGNGNIDTLHILSLYNKLAGHGIVLDPLEWFEISTDRINEYHVLEKELFLLVGISINNEIKETKNQLLLKVFLNIFTILILFFTTHYISKRIKYSIVQLNHGMNNFFDFLNYKREKPEDINTHSEDEISDIAKSINKQMHLIEQTVEADMDFINETTQIVTLMKDGDFSERPYFEPNNPHLLELKDVFNQLIELIAKKIKEQTDSLESLNASLEDRVHFQTLELEKQIEEITIAMDKAIAAEKAKDEFLANMSHEIRTPLNAILGFVTILKKTIKDEKPLKYLNIIDTSGKSLLTIINDILDFSKIQSGNFTISPHATNIVEEMSNATLLFASKAYEKHLIYDVYIDPNMPQSISVDTVRVKQIFSNILSNAIKFTPYDRSIKVKVVIIDSRLHISVQDTGIGIAEENISKVFKAFEQADGSTSRKYGGTGLGLSISYKLAQLMDGDLSVISKEGVGSTFTLEVPVEILNKEPSQYTELSTLKDKKIALLGHPVNFIKLKVIKKYLQDFGVTEIITLEEFQKDGYDLLFFTPDDLYNEEIIENNIPSIAILRNSAVKIASIEHVHALYAPFTPSIIMQSIIETGITSQDEKHS